MSRNQIIATDEVSTEIAPVAASAEPSVRGTVADFSLRTSIVESGSGPQDEDAEENEPKVTSSDPAIRKLARRLRIKRRVETIKKQHENEDEEESKVNKTALEIQVLASAENLEKLLLEGEELITNVLVGGDRCEVERREVERQLRQELLEKLDEEAREATAALEQINARWSELMVQDDPLDVHDGIAAQKTLCEDLLAQKDALIGELRSELDSLELEYEGALESQKEDLALLGTRIDSQAELMRQAYRHELQLLETTADGERLQSLEENLQAWRTLHQRRDELEEQNMLKKIQQQDGFLEELQANRVANEELYRDTKTALEREIQLLQQELEHMRAFCMLNEEKLDYNYQILKKREDENTIIKSQQKRMLNKLRDELGQLRRRTEEQREWGRQTERTLEREIHKLRESLFQVEAKADLLQTVNDNKYRQVWQHNEQLAERRLREILSADRVFSEHLLGQEWQQPRRLRVRVRLLPSYRMAMALGARGDWQQGSTGPRTAYSPATQSARHYSDETSGYELPDPLQRTVFGHIAERADFLLEERLVPLIESLDREQGDVVRVDSVFAALGVTRSEDMAQLMDCFAPYIYCKLCESADPMQQLDMMSATDTGSHGKATTMRTTSLQTMRDIIEDVQQPVYVVEEIVNMETELDSLVDHCTMLTMETGTAAGTVGAVSALLDLGANKEPSLSSVSESAQAENRGVLGSCLGMRPGHFMETHPIFIDAAHVLKALREFTVRNGATGAGVLSGGGAAAPQDTDREPTVAERIKRDRITISRSLSQKDVDIFWGQYAQALPEDRLQLWDALTYGLTRYYSILQDRHRINLDVQRVRRQNGELKHLLQSTMPAAKKKKKAGAKTPASVCSFVTTIKAGICKP